MLLRLFGLADLLAALFLLFVSFESAFLNVLIKSLMIIHLYKGTMSFL